MWITGAASYLGAREKSSPYIQFGQIYMEKITKPVFFALLITKWDCLAGLATKDNNNEGD